MFNYHGYSGPCPKPLKRSEEMINVAGADMRIAELEDRLKEAQQNQAMECGHAFRFFQPYPYAISADGSRIEPKCSECERIAKLTKQAE